jgi:hypothetical protein
MLDPPLHVPGRHLYHFHQSWGLLNDPSGGDGSGIIKAFYGINLPGPKVFAREAKYLVNFKLEVHT